MMKELEYPFDSDFLLKKRKKIKEYLLKNLSEPEIRVKIGILGGSTTKDIVSMLEIFLLNFGITPEFYESGYNQYWQDVMFPNPELDKFQPDIIYIHTSNRNIESYPGVENTASEIDGLLEKEYARFYEMWERIRRSYHSVIIQNNFEYPYYRLLGNRDGYDIHGKTYFIRRLNQKFYEYAQNTEGFYIHDINYISSAYGLKEWSDPFYWYMYKYSLCFQAIPEFAYNLANIIKALYGKNKKAVAVDLDNCLWGGVVGDDGIENLKMGSEEAVGEAYLAFQKYLKELKSLGILLTVNSKNDLENAIKGLRHPDCALKPEDFQILKANWNRKSQNLSEIAKELNILEESIIFLDDSPAECEEVRCCFPEVAVVEMKAVEHFIQDVDRGGYFELVNYSQEDVKRNQMYQQNKQRKEAEKGYLSYEEYLMSLKMVATIGIFEPVYIERIVQLINKTNQFNLTTRRYTKKEIETISESKNYLHLYGKLDDRFGENGIVTVIIGRKEQDLLHIELWTMSCRVFKRGLEYAMFDTLVGFCKKEKISAIKGYYYPSAKNSMVKDFYGELGFAKVKEEDGGTEWKYRVQSLYKRKNNIIEIREKTTNGGE